MAPKRKEWPGKEAFFIVWCIDAEQPPKRMYQLQAQAEEAAKAMAHAHRRAFYVLRCVKKFELPPTDVQVTTYD